jgi:hypothetical protein
MGKNIFLSTFLACLCLVVLSSGQAQASESVLGPEHEISHEVVLSAVDRYAQENSLSDQDKALVSKVVQESIDAGYNVNWQQFDFKNTDQDNQATSVAKALDSILTDALSQLTKDLIAVGADKEKTDKINAQRQVLSAKQDRVMSSWSAAFTGDPSLMSQ